MCLFEAELTYWYFLNFIYLFFIILIIFIFNIVIFRPPKVQDVVVKIRGTASTKPRQYWAGIKSKLYSDRAWCKPHSKLHIWTISSSSS